MMARLPVLALTAALLALILPISEAPAQRAKARPKPAAKTVTVVSVMPAFWRFHARRYAGDAERVAAFRAQVLKPHPELYGNFIDLPEERVFPAYFARLEPLVGEMRALDPLYRREIDRTVTRLRTMLGPLDAHVYLAPSLFSSDGQVQWIGGRPVVMFGIDVRAFAERGVLAGSGRRDVRAAVLHEFIHAYHFQRNSEARGAIEANPPPLYQTLWIEGLATCLSHRWALNGTMARSLSSPQLVREVPGKVHALAAELAGQLDTARFETRRDWFWLNGKRTDLPPRAGYAIGMLAADRVVKRMTAVQALALSGPKLRAEVAAALAALAAPGYTVNWARTCR
jgi:hypothetical protein